MTPSAASKSRGLSVTMYTGQNYEGGTTPGIISKQLKAEGVWPVYIVTDNPRDFDAAEGVVVEHRDHLDAVQRKLRETPGITAIIYEQTCAAEKRRRRGSSSARGSVRAAGTVGCSRTA